MCTERRETEARFMLSIMGRSSKKTQAPQAEKGDGGAEVELGIFRFTDEMTHCISKSCVTGDRIAECRRCPIKARKNDSSDLLLPRLSLGVKRQRHSGVRGKDQ